MSKLINLSFGSVNRLLGSKELEYYMRLKGLRNRLKGRGERYIIADDAQIEKDRVKEIMESVKS